MAAAPLTKEIEDSIKEKKIIIGSKYVLKSTKSNQVRIIICATNIPPPLKRDLERYAGISGAELKPFEGDSLRLGQVCGKPFKILAIGIKKA